MSENENPSMEYQEEAAEGISEDAMIRNLRRYRELKGRLEQAEERGRRYVEQVKAEVEQDLVALRTEVDFLKEGFEVYIKEYNGGENFKVPGLGTAFVQRRRTAKVADEQKFGLYVLNAYPARYDAVFVAQPDKLNKKEADKLVKAALEDGEILPGVEVEEAEALAVRLTGGGVRGR